MRSKAAPGVVHHMIIHWRFQSKKNPTAWSKQGGGNNIMDTVVIKLINQWREREEERGTESSLLMRQVYMQASIVVVASLRFSQSH